MGPGRSAHTDGPGATSLADSPPTEFPPGLRARFPSLPKDPVSYPLLPQQIPSPLKSPTADVCCLECRTQASEFAVQAPIRYTPKVVSITGKAVTEGAFAWSLTGSELEKNQ